VDLDIIDRAILTVLRYAETGVPRSPTSHERWVCPRLRSRGGSSVWRTVAQSLATPLSCYTALIDDQHTGSLEAFTEIRLAGGIETSELGLIVKEVPEVQQFFTIAGDPDALLRIRVDDVDHLQRVVNALRRTGKLAGTKTLIVLHTWDRAHEAYE